MQLALKIVQLPAQKGPEDWDHALHDPVVLLRDWLSVLLRLRRRFYLTWLFIFFVVWRILKEPSTDLAVLLGGALRRDKTASRLLPFVCRPSSSGYTRLYLHRWVLSLCSLARVGTITHDTAERRRERSYMI